MNLLDRLGAEHQVFLRQLDELERCLDSRGSDLVSVLQATASVLHSALEYHAECEESQLFPHLIPHLGSSGGPVQVMEMEHQQLRKEMDTVSKSSPSSESLDNVKRAMRNYIGVLRDHIAKEDSVLFPMSRNFLPADKLNELDETCPHLHNNTQVKEDMSMKRDISMKGSCCGSHHTQGSHGHVH